MKQTVSKGITSVDLIKEKKKELHCSILVCFYFFLILSFARLNSEANQVIAFLFHHGCESVE